MRNYIAAAALAAITGVNADLCSLGSELLEGNYYCQAVTAITYDNFESSGTYPLITNMDVATGTCSSTPQSFSGSLAPLNGQVSMSFRGPIQLKQFAFYSPSSSSSKKRSSHDHHGHAHFHERRSEVREVQEQAELKKRQEVTAVIDGATVSWEWGAPAATNNGWITAVIDGATVSWANTVAAPTGAAVAAAESFAGSGDATKAPYKAPAPAASGDWVREAYYNAATGTANGVTFLNNMGGQGSGTFDYTFGNSLSYASADGLTGAASPQVLADTTVPSGSEFLIMTDKECTASSCGYSRPGSVAMEGFDGSDKLFMMEFAMPDDGTSGWNMNMPAIWMLNALIPRTQQYGSCSCWPNCGEFDLFEVLTSGETRAKSTLHSVISGGDSDYFVRPSAPIKAAVLMSNSQAHIKVLPDSYDFSQNLTPSQVNEIAESTITQGDGVSIFTLG